MDAATVDLRELARDLAHAGGIGIHDAARRIIVEGAERVASQEAVFAPRKTGRLVQSITISYPNSTTAVIGPTVPYSPYVEFGTHGPYEIRPRKPGGVLVFYVGGRKVVVKKVTHPGNKAQPFARPAAAEVSDWLAGQLAQAGSDLITR